MTEQISLFEVAIYAFVSFFMAILSATSGGGAGFITTPLLIIFGLSPAQAVATGKVYGLSVAVASLKSMGHVRERSYKQIAPILVLALIIGLIAPFIITNLNDELYRHLLGVVLLIMAPFLLIKKIGYAENSPDLGKQSGGYVLLALTLFMQAVFSGGMGALVNVVLMVMLGMTALQASITKRLSQLILNSVIIIGVVFSGFIIWPIAIVGVITASLGGLIGGRMAIDRGNKFIMSVLVFLMFASGVLMLLG